MGTEMELQRVSKKVQYSNLKVLEIHPKVKTAFFTLEEGGRAWSWNCLVKVDQ